MSQSVVISSRFNGPPHSANGGYACGVLGTLIGDSAEVTLRKPPPLDRALTIEVEGVGDERHLRLLDGDLLIASARAAEPQVSIPEPPTFAAARAAEAAYEGFSWHHFPSCFVCGPARSEGDGLCLFTGKLPGRDVVASSWTPAPSIAGRDGSVERSVVWSALDCPSYFGGRMQGFGRFAVLGRLTATLREPVQIGAEHIVIGWPIAQEGRKWDGGSAIFTAQGELCAFARGRWIELNEADYASLPGARSPTQ
jgi:hypothetical protein